MGIGASKFLGLAVKDHAILAAEVHVAGERRTLVRTAQLVFPAGLSWEEPQTLGPVLRTFLRKEHFSASRAIVGVPARWLMASEKQVPPASPQLAADALRLQAERLFSHEINDLVFDYAGHSDPKQARKVLLVAMLRHHQDRIQKLADAAGLSLLAITPASLTLNAAVASSSSNSVSLLVESDAAELILQEEGTPRLLRYLPITAAAQNSEIDADLSASLSLLSSEVKRAAVLLPSSASSTRSIAIWDAIGLPPVQADLLAQRLGMGARFQGDLALLNIAASNGSARDAARFGPAIALALAGAKPQLLAVNFLHSRLTQEKTRRIGHRTVLAAIVILATLASACLLVWDLRRAEAELADLQTRLEKMQPDIRDAENIATRVSFARDWYERRPPFLSCLQEVSSAFPADGQIWASNFSIRDNRTAQSRPAQLAGRATDQLTVLTVLDRLKNNKKFADVKVQDMRDAGGNRREVSFSVNFNFVALE